MRRYCLPLLVVVLSADLRADEPDLPGPIIKAQMGYQLEIKAAKGEVSARLDERMASARAKGDAVALKKLNAEADAFNKDATFPPSLPPAERMRYYAAIHKAQATAIAAYQDVIKVLVQQSKDAEAGKIEAAKRKFAKSLEPTLTLLPVSGAEYQIAVRKSGLVLAVHEGSKADRAEIIQWKIDEHEESERWELQAIGEFLAIVNRKSGKALTALGVAQRIVQLPLSKTAAAQQWKFVGVDPGWFKIVNRLTGKVLDIDNGSGDPGARLIQWPDAGRAKHHQQFQLRMYD